MRCRRASEGTPLVFPPVVFPLVALALVLVAGLAGCGRQEAVVPAAPEGQVPADLGLGPGVRPLTSGPGDKGSPSWSPSGDRLAFVVDGYVVDEPATGEAPGDGPPRRWTTRDFGAEKVAWLSGRRLAILSRGRQPGGVPGGVPGETAAAEPSGSLYRALPGEDAPEVSRVATDALAVAPGPNDRSLVAVLRTGAAESQLAVVRNGEDVEVYPAPVGDRVTGLSVSPDGRRAVLCAEEDGAFELHVFRFSDGSSETLARLEEGLRIFGAPQWTERGVYFVAGAAAETPGDAGAYALYRVAPGSGEPEAAPGVGEGFVAQSIRRDAEGRRLAVVGRRSAGSPTDLYVLDVASGELSAATANENMEIKTGPDDLAWSPDGDRVAIVARGVLSGPRLRPAPAGALVADFYNLYEVPVAQEGAGEGEAPG